MLETLEELGPPWHGYVDVRFFFLMIALSRHRKLYTVYRYFSLFSQNNCKPVKTTSLGSTGSWKLLLQCPTKGGEAIRSCAKETLKALFGCCRIHLNPHVLEWIEVEFSSISTSSHLNTRGLMRIRLHPNKTRRCLFQLIFGFLPEAGINIRVMN